LDQTLSAAYRLLKDELSSAQVVLSALFPITQIRAELQKARQLNTGNDTALLYELKVACLARTLAAIYYIAIAEVLIHVQLAISARHMLDSASGQRTTGEPAAPQGLLHGPHASLTNQHQRNDFSVAAAAARATLTFASLFPGHSYVCAAEPLPLPDPSSTAQVSPSSSLFLDAVVAVPEVGESKSTTRGPLLLALARLARVCVEDSLHEAKASTTSSKSRVETLIEDSTSLEWAKTLLTEEEAQQVLVICRRRMDRVLFAPLSRLIAAYEIKPRQNADSHVVSNESHPPTMQVESVHDLVHVTEIPAYSRHQLLQEGKGEDASNEDKPCATMSKQVYCQILVNALRQYSEVQRAQSARKRFVDPRLGSIIVDTASRFGSLPLSETYHVPSALAALCFGIPEFKVQRKQDEDAGSTTSVLAHLIYPSALSREIHLEARRRKFLRQAGQRKAEEEALRPSADQASATTGEETKSVALSSQQPVSQASVELDQNLKLLGVYAEQLEEAATIIRTRTFRATLQAQLDKLFSGLSFDVSKLYPIPTDAVAGPLSSAPPQPALKVFTRIASHFDDLFGAVDLTPIVASDESLYIPQDPNFALVSLCRTIYMPMNQLEEKFGKRSTTRPQLPQGMGGIPGLPPNLGDLDSMFGDQGDLDPAALADDPQLQQIMSMLQNTDGQGLDVDRLEQLVSVLEEMERNHPPVGQQRPHLPPSNGSNQ